MKANEFVLEHGWDAAKRLVENNKHTGRTLSPSELELKRLVESYELVESYGGINGARKELANLCDNLIDCAYLCQTIVDVESFDSYTPMMSR